MSDISLNLAQYRAAQPTLWAMKIGTVTEIESGRTVLAPADGLVALIVDEKFLMNYKPQVGDWFVVYPDGHQSLMSADIFEDPHGGFFQIEQKAV